MMTQDVVGWKQAYALGLSGTSTNHIAKNIQPEKPDWSLSRSPAQPSRRFHRALCPWLHCVTRYEVRAHSRKFPE